VDEYDVGVDRYLDILRTAVEQVDIPVLGSLNGVTSEWWIEYATHMEQAGAAGIELNVFYVPVDPDREGWEVEREYIDILAAVKGAVKIPVAIKLNPFFSSFAHMAHRLDEAGADGLVLFNRFYQPDFDLETLEVEPRLELSGPSEIRLPLLWIAVLCETVGSSLAATTGVETGREVIKYLLAGADVVMTTSALLRHGPGHLGTLRAELESWMAERGYDSVARMRGSMSHRSVQDPARFLRANYIRILEDWKGLGTA
jgi:dihydroorotate dehydrogenase (fumarate)